MGMMLLNQAPIFDTPFSALPSRRLQLLVFPVFGKYHLKLNEPFYILLLVAVTFLLL